MALPRELAKNLGLSLATVLSIGLLAEAGLRMAGFIPIRWRPRPLVLKNSQPPLFLDCYPTNPRGTFDLDLRQAVTRAHYEAVFGRSLAAEAASAPYAVEVRFNSLHLRGPEFPPPRPGVRRVVVVGDSFTEGQGVREDDTYPRRLQALLDAAEPGRWEVLNAGRRGADFPHLYTYFETLVPQLQPDLVVYGMVLNDTKESASFVGRYPYLNDWISRGEVVGAAPPPSSLIQSRLAALVGERVEAFRVGRQSIAWYRDLYGPANAEGWGETQAFIRNMHRTMRARHGRFLVATWPLLVALDGAYPFEGVHETIGRFCRDAGIRHLDLLPALRGRRPETLWVHPLDKHPNELAHRLAASSLAPALLEMGPRLDRD